MRKIVEAERFPADERKRQTGLIVTHATCGHKHFVGAPTLLPSQALGMEHQCGVFPEQEGLVASRDVSNVLIRMSEAFLRAADRMDAEVLKDIDIP